MTSTPDPEPLQRATNNSSSDSQDLIDHLDRQILDLVQQRQSAVRAQHAGGKGELVGHITEAVARINRLLNERESNQGTKSEPLISRSSGASLLAHVSSICLQSIHEFQAVYLGPQHSYSHLAAIKYFGDATTLTPVASIPAVFEAVTREDALSGIVPIENSTDGRVVDTLGMFVKAEMQICGEVLLPIHHNLLQTI